LFREAKELRLAPSEPLNTTLIYFEAFYPQVLVCFGFSIHIHSVAGISTTQICRPILMERIAVLVIKKSGVITNLNERLGEKSDSLLKKTQSTSGDLKIVAIGDKLDHLSKILDLYPYDDKGHFQGKLKPTSHDELKPVLLICLNSSFCVTEHQSLMQHSPPRDIPTVTLIKGNEIHKNAYVLTGICSSYKTLYLADCERLTNSDNTVSQMYLNLFQQIPLELMGKGKVLVYWAESR
jgi:hypothetical protein